MFFHILKKDLKRKKIMNIILFIFIILSSMFISSSVGNFVTVTKALDHFFNDAGLTDYYAGCLSNGTEYANIEPALKELKNIKNYKIENEVFIIKEEQFQVNGHSVEMPSALIISSFENRIYKYYNTDNTEITSINPNEIYICTSSARQWNINLGDTITLTIGDYKKDFKVSGFYKDAMFNPQYVGSKRVVISQQDFENLYNRKSTIPYTGSMANINTDNASALNTEFGKLDSDYKINFNIPKSMLKNAYIMDILITVILIIFSIFIMIIAITILRFTIRFTMEEDYREIGIMKAIGIPLYKTRWMYVTKYTVLGILGSTIGLFIGIPFANMLISKTAEDIVISGQGNIIFNILASCFTALFIILSSYHATKKMKKFKPMDAIRNGETGERYSQKGKLALHKSKCSIPLFLAINDLTTNIRRYLVMLISFTLSLILIVILSNTANTLNSTKMVNLFGVQESDVYLGTDYLDMDKVFSDHWKSYIQEHLDQVHQNLEKNGIPNQTSIEIWVRVPIQNNEKIISPIALYGIGTNIENYKFIEGSAPQNDNEIALTPFNAKNLNVTIGDTVECSGKKCIVTGLFDCFNNMGDSARFHSSFPTDLVNVEGCSTIQIQFTDHPNDKQILNYVNKIKALYPDTKIRSTEDFVRDILSSTGDILTGLKNLAIVIVILISILMVILMERSFISKEKNEIALLKAIGFKNGTLMLWHCIRILLLVIIATLLSLLISTPLTKLCVSPIFNMMGVSQIEFAINPIENYIVYPIIMIGFTVTSTWAISQFMRNIHASDTSNIE